MHHAFLCVGSFSKVLSYLPVEDRITGIDVHHEFHDSFGIDEARRLKEASNLRPVSGTHCTFVLVCASLTHEAQNALLKLFEEPTGSVIFYLVVPHEDILLPTLRSRLRSIDVVSEYDDTQVAIHFLKLSYSDRLIEIAARTKDKDTVWIACFLTGIELWVLQNTDKELLRDIILVRSYERNKSASKRCSLNI